MSITVESKDPRKDRNVEYHVKISGFEADMVGLFAIRHGLTPAAWLTATFAEIVERESKESSPRRDNLSALTEDPAWEAKT